MLPFLIREEHQDMKTYREKFAALAGSIVCESTKLTTLGQEVAQACTEEGLKKVTNRHYKLLFSAQ